MDLSLNKLKEAISIRTQIDTLERRLAGIFGSGRGSSSRAVSRGGQRRRTMSAATRAKLSAAARARWAKRRGGRAGAAGAAQKSRKRGGLTAEGRRKLSEAMKARWAARRKAAAAKK
jgi:hypothetical protein